MCLRDESIVLRRYHHDIVAMHKLLHHNVDISENFVALIHTNDKDEFIVIISKEECN